MNKIAILSCAIFAFAVIPHSVNAAKLLTMVTGCNLVEVDSVTGQRQTIGNIGFGAEGYAYGLDGTLFATADPNHCNPHGGANTLIRIDRQTGAGTAIGNIGFGDVDALTVAADGTMYGVSASGSTLIRIDPNTGQGTAIGATGAGFIEGLDFAADGTLYAIDMSTGGGGPSTLWTIDTQTGQGTVVGSIGFNSVDGIAFGTDGKLYGISDRFNGGTGQFLEIDRNTGQGTALFQFLNNGESADSLISAVPIAAVPEASSSVLLAIAVVGLFFRNRIK